MEVRAVVIDSGTGTCKAGFAGDAAPRAIIPSVVGRHNLSSAEVQEREINAVCPYVGNEVHSTGWRHILSLKHPIERGVITSWGDMEAVWHHAFHSQLRVFPEEQNVLVTEAPQASPRPSREKVAQIMFECFAVPGLCVAAQAPLALHASGRATGLVLDSGEGVTHTVPVCEEGCAAAPGAALRLDLAGGDLTAYMERILADRGHSLQKEPPVARDIKEKLGYVAIDFDAEVMHHTTPSPSPSPSPSSASATAASFEKRYELPDGQAIMIGNESFMCPEALFRPSLIGMEAVGIHETCYSSISKCDVEIRGRMYGNILLSGGTTMFPGLPARLHKEMTALAPPGTRVNVIAPPGRQNYAWVGGSNLASLSTSQIWITKEDYDNSGPSVVHSKCY
ncbi:actin 11 [Pelomyxa schiedti]|nr:actin 11 [Pelomyxa schiedti]